MDLLIWAAVTAVGLLLKFLLKGRAAEAPASTVPDPRSVAERLATSLRVTRIITAAMLVFVVSLAVFISRLATPASPGPLDDSIRMAITAMAVMVGISGLAAHKLMVEPAAAALRQRMDDEQARGRWQTGKIVGAASAEAVALFGFVLHMLGLEPERAALFYAASALLLIFHYPRGDALPLEEAERQAALAPARRTG